MLVLSIVVEVAFTRYLENDLSYLLEMGQHQFSPTKEATEKISAHGNCPLNVKIRS